MRLINVQSLNLETFFGDQIPPYAILSHRWGADREEVSYHDIEIGNLKARGNGSKKLEGCCNQAKKDGLGYAWIDTCCIDRTNSVELGEAINSMFRWYKEASICYVYLSDVPSEDNFSDQGSKFFSSRWFRRGWTLQELLAPKNLRFYDQTWASIGTKKEMSGEVETITGIPRRFLLGWEELHEASVAQRMSWAAKRDTTRKEDIAYCLLGIFRISMPIIYGGDGDYAFSRLQEEIMKKMGDDSILAWGLSLSGSIPSESADVVSAGILATAPSDFANCGGIVPRKQDASPVNTFDISGGRLRMHLSLHTTSAGEIYGLLNCGPERNTEEIVGIPLHKAVSSTVSDEYLRPQGHYPDLFSKTTSSALVKTIHIWIERQSRAHEAASRRYWLYVDGHRNIDLKLTDVHPPVHWDNGRAMIAEANDSDRNITRQYLARFRTQGEESRDVVVVLEFEIQGLQAQARCHVMTLSRDTALEDLSQKLIYMRPEAFGKQTASNSNFNVKVTVKEEQIAKDPMFVVRLARASSSPEATVDATLEQQEVDLKLEFVRILQEKDQIRLTTELLDRHSDEKKATLVLMRERLEAVEENLRKLDEDKALLIDRLHKEILEAHDLTIRRNEVKQQRDKLLGRELEIQQRLDKLDTKEGPRNWLETIIKTMLDADNMNSETPLSWAATKGHEAVARLLLEKGADLESKDKYGNTLLLGAVFKGQEAVVRFLLENGADLESKNNDGSTPLIVAVFKKHEALIRLLLEKGADLESKNNEGNTPLLQAAFNGHVAITRLLLEKGANLESKDNYGYTPLLGAVFKGHEAVVRLLLEKGANLESKNNDDRTPLTVAIHKRHEAIIRLLLEKGADLKSKNNNGSISLSRLAGPDRGTADQTRQVTIQSSGRDDTDEGFAGIRNHIRNLIKYSGRSM
jgi:ankyrin repeat protein